MAACLWTPGTLCKRDSFAIHLKIWKQLLKVAPWKQVFLYFVNININNLQFNPFPNHCGSDITKPWYDKQTSWFLSLAIHSWTVGIQVSSSDFKLKNYTLFQVFKGEIWRWILFGYWVNINYFISSWNKANSSISVFHFLGDFLGIVGVLKSDGLDFESFWFAGTRCNYQGSLYIFLPSFINFSSKWLIHMI